MLIPNDTILYDNNTPFHEIPMYRSLLAHHISLLGRVIPCDNSKNYDNLLDSFTGSFAKSDEIDKSYQSSSGNKLILPIAESSIKFTLEFKQPCFFYECGNNNMFCIRHEKTLFLVFNTGAKLYDVHNINFYYDEHGNRINQTFTIRFLQQFFKNILPILPSIEQIVFSGHSNGFAAATSLSFLFLSMISESFRDRNKEMIGNLFSDLANDFTSIEKITQLLQNKSLFVVGTGGFPILFSSLVQFKDYYNELKGRYVHVLSGVTINNTVYVDSFGSPLPNLYNYKFAIYYEDNNDYKSIDIKKYTGTKFFFKVVSNEQLLDNTNYDSIVTLKKETFPYNRVVYRNKKSGKFTFIPHDMFIEKEGNNFLACGNDNYSEKNNELNNKECSTIKHRIHQLYTYRSILSVFIYKTETPKQRERRERDEIKREQEQLKSRERIKYVQRAMEEDKRRIQQSNEEERIRNKIEKELKEKRYRTVRNKHGSKQKNKSIRKRR
jgi:hypothetical protein